MNTCVCMYVDYAWTYRGFMTRMVYLKHDIQSRFTVLVGSPRYVPKHTCSCTSMGKFAM